LTKIFEKIGGRIMAKYNMYAYAHMNDVKVIQITSLGDFHTKITTSTKVEPGVITNLETIFDKGKKPFPFEFIWIPDKYIPASFTNSLKPRIRFQPRSTDTDTGRRRCEVPCQLELRAVQAVEIVKIWWRGESAGELQLLPIGVVV
jgi:hypothetical protein